MLYPVYINIIDRRDNRDFIVAGVVDLHISKIQRVVKQPDGFVSIKVEDGWMKLGISFEELINILREHAPIDMRFKESVDAYINSNFRSNI